MALSVWLILTMVALALVLLGEYLGRRALVWIFKPAASAGFLGAAISAGAMETIYGQAVFMALIWSLLGDVFLIPRGSKSSFMFGLFSFLVGHIAFAFAFGLRGVDAQVAWLTAAGLLIPSAVVFRWLKPHLPAGMVGPVVAYILVIGAMVAMAAGTYAHAADPVLLGAALMFYLSDLTVARQRFISPGITNRLIGLPLYYAAQLMFAVTAGRWLVFALGQGDAGP